MRKTIFITICAMGISGLWAQELPKWSKKARKAVFSVITYNADNKILNTGNGFYIDSEGTGVSDYSLFKGAHKAVVVTSDGKELPVTLILGANDMYDVTGVTDSCYHTRKGKREGLYNALLNTKLNKRDFRYHTKR